MGKFNSPQELQNNLKNLGISFEYQDNDKYKNIITYHNGEYVFNLTFETKEDGTIFPLSLLLPESLRGHGVTIAMYILVEKESGKQISWGLAPTLTSRHLRKKYGHGKYFGIADPYEEKANDLIIELLESTNIDHFNSKYMELLIHREENPSLFRDNVFPELDKKEQELIAFEIPSLRKMIELKKQLVEDFKRTLPVSNSISEASSNIALIEELEQEMDKLIYG